MKNQFTGFDGILGTNASLALDALVLSMVLILFVMSWSIYLAKYRQQFTLHKWIQVTLGIILLVAVVLFEIDIRLHGWEDRAAGEINGSASSMVWNALYVHLVFAISTVILWPIVIIRALRNFPSPIAPGPHSHWHVFWARLAAIDMIMTAITGWTFYWVAFVA